MIASSPRAIQRSGTRTRIPRRRVDADIVAPPIGCRELPELAEKTARQGDAAEDGFGHADSSTRPCGPTREGLDAIRRPDKRPPDDGSSGGLGRRLECAHGGAEQERAGEAPGSRRLTLATPRSAARPCRACMCVVLCRPCAAAARIGRRSPRAGRWRAGCSRPGPPASAHREASCRPWPPRLRAALPRSRRRASRRDRLPSRGRGAHRPCPTQGSIVPAAVAAGLALQDDGGLRQRLGQGSAASRHARWTARLAPWPCCCHGRRRRSPRRGRRAGQHGPGSCRASPRSAGKRPLVHESSLVASARRSDWRELRPQEGRGQPKALLGGSLP